MLANPEQQRRDEDTEITLAKPIEEIVKLLPIVFDPNQHLLDNLQEWKKTTKKTTPFFKK